MILVTGGCGYIGSHFITKLIENGNDVVSIDNLSNSSSDILDNMKQISGRSHKFILGDVRDNYLLEEVFFNYNISVVIHFAGLKSASESITNAIEYFSSNVAGSINLFETMLKFRVNKIIFSSSALVYENSDDSPWSENTTILMPTNPYAQTKYIVEQLLNNIASREENFRVGVLRYFNPIGSHSSGLIGENFTRENGNLFPAIVRVLMGYSKNLKIFGKDYDTLDGTGVRDYLHIDDLIDGHLKAMDFINENQGFNIWNLGSGKGYSVLEIIKEIENQNKYPIPFEFEDRRVGDLDSYWADVTKAKQELNWFSNKGVSEMVRDTLRYVDKNKK